MEYIYIIFHQQKWGLLHVLVVDKQPWTPTAPSHAAMRPVSRVPKWDLLHVHGGLRGGSWRCFMYFDIVLI